MSHLRSRKLHSTNCDNLKPAPQTRGPVSKESGDAAIGVKHPRSKSKSKLPKSVKYDLDNALLGLCDVWFEEIKPYLLRNNIKVHVYNDEECVEGGDHGKPSARASGCSHLDPGADTRRQRKTVSCVGCCSTQQTASKARSPKLRTPPLASVPPLSLNPTTEQAKSQFCIKVCPPHNKKQSRKRVRRRHTTNDLNPEPLTKYRVPRLCQTYSIQSNNSHIVNRVRTVQRSPIKRAPKFCDKATQTDWDELQIRLTADNNRKYKLTPARKGLKQAIIKKSLPTKVNPTKESPLLPDDVINIIADRYENKIEVLYHSPHSNKYTSIMNLAPSTSAQKSLGSNWKKKFQRHQKKGVVPWK